MSGHMSLAGARRRRVWVVDATRGAWPEARPPNAQERVWPGAPTEGLPSPPAPGHYGRLEPPSATHPRRYGGPLRPHPGVRAATVATRGYRGSTGLRVVARLARLTP